MLSLKPIAVSVVSAVAILLFSTISVAQDQNGKDLQEALKTLQGGPIHLSANLEIEEAETDGKKNNMSGMMGVVGSVLSSSGSTTTAAKPFAGDLDVEVTQDGTISAIASEGLSQIKVMHNGEKSLFSQTYSDTVYDLGKLTGLLRSTLNVDALIEEIDEVKRVRVKENDGIKTYRATIAGGFFDVSTDGPGGGKSQQEKMVALALSKMAPGILEGVLSVDVDQSGKPLSAKYELQYSDPMSGLMKKAMKQNGAKGADLSLNLDILAKPDPGEKVILTYMFKSDANPTAQQFAVEAAELLKSQE